MAVMLGVGALIGCGPEEVETAKPIDFTAMAISGRAEDGAGDDGDDGGDASCEDDPQAPGCPWDPNAVNAGPEGVWGNTDPRSMAVVDPRPANCPKSAVMGELIPIPAGEFVMGCDDLDSERCGSRERGLETVDLPAFEIDRTEVTQAAYQKCVEAGACSAPAGGFEPTRACTHPVVNVSWKQASQYCAWMDRRLPTEAEWEKAARGTDQRTFPWGDEEPTCELANFAGCGRREAEEVGSHPAGASPYGLQDMAGNVREWVFDREDGRARQPKRGIRGGMFTDQGMQLRAARRQWGDVSVSDIGIGFRCAR